MKIIKVSEVIDEINNLIDNKEQEQEQLEALSDEIHNIINLDDALQGEGGKAITEHFTTLHKNALILFNLFLEEYIHTLNAIKSTIESFESRTGMIHTEFLREDIINKLSELDNFTNEIVNDINKQYDEVSDLVADGRVSTYYLNLNIANAGSHAEDTAIKLETLDKESTSSLYSSENNADELSQFTSKIESWTKDGVFFNRY